MRVSVDFDISLSEHINRVADELASLDDEQQADFISRFFSTLRIRCKDNYYHQVSCIGGKLDSYSVCDETIECLKNGSSS